MSLAHDIGIGMREQARIVGALMLRDMRTRFGRTHLSYLVAVAWPLCHMFVIYLSFVFVSKYVPLGGSAGIFIATGAAPYILCLYPARQVALAIILNVPLLQFPILKSTDIILARAAVEVVGSLIVIISFVLILLAFDVDILPPDIPEAAAGILASIYLGVSFGILNVVICSIFRFWFFIFIFLMVAMYVTSGVTTLQLSMTETTREILSYNPLLHLVTWLRTAYYGEYSLIPLSKSYVMAVATVSFCLGMLGDRILRGRILLVR